MNTIQQRKPQQEQDSAGPDSVLSPPPQAGKKEAVEKAPSAFRTISEVADDLGVQQHVLRFWETKFSQIKPLKRGGGRRYYRPEDVALLKRIHDLLYTEGYTIKGVQKLLKGQGKQQILAGAPEGKAADAPKEKKSSAIAQKQADVAETVRQDSKRPLSDRQKVILESMLGELKDLRSLIRGEEG